MNIEILTLISGIAIFIILILIINLILSIHNYFRENKEIKQFESKIKRKKLNFNEVLAHKNNLQQKYFQQISLFLTTILVLSTVYFSYLSGEIQKDSINAQINLANENINFLKQTSNSNFADIKIDYRSPEYDNPLRISATNLANLKGYNLGLIAVNSGKINSGNINSDTSTNKDKNIFAYLSSTIKIEPQTGKELDINLRQYYCSGDGTKNDCNSSLLPEGSYNLTIAFRCEFCSSENRIINFTIPLCIYHENYSVCYKF